MQQKRTVFLVILALVLIASTLWGISTVMGQKESNVAPFTPETAATPQPGATVAGGSSAASGVSGTSTAPQALVAGPTPTEVSPLAQIIPTVAAALDGGETVLAVGDIGTCSRKNDDAVAELARQIGSPVLLLGDTVYEDGTKSEFARCFDPAWGSFKDRIKPVPGNHDYQTARASAYYDYFGANAGDPSTGYYSYDIGSWHIIALNSNCEVLDGGCGASSPQVEWLKADLAAHPSLCTLAYWHHARFSSGEHGDHEFMKPIWDTLYAAGVEVVLNGHDHNYERFAPQNPDGQPDPAGIREFIVGTGGKNLRSITRPEANSEVFDDSSFGLLKLTLAPAGYGWEFLPTDGGTFTDSGQGICH